VSDGFVLGGGARCDVGWQPKYQPTLEHRAAVRRAGHDTRVARLRALLDRCNRRRQKLLAQSRATPTSNTGRIIRLGNLLKRNSARIVKLHRQIDAARTLDQPPRGARTVVDPQRADAIVEAS